MWETSLDADAASLSAALAESGMPEADVRQTIVNYRAVRVAMAPTPEQLVTNQPAVPVNAQSLDEVTAKIPREFALYAQGAALYHTHDWDGAVSKWKSLLALPESERRHRSVWAAYMIARATTDTNEAAAHYDMTRDLAKAGFDDPLNLAGESIGWQAKMDLNNGNIVAAIHGYAQPFLNPDSPAMPDYISLGVACAIALETTAVLPEAVQDDVCRIAISTYVVSHPDSRNLAKKWLEAVSRAGLKGEMAHADLLAFTAYQLGDFETASRWIETIVSPTPYSKWVQSKLLLRQGQIDDAVALLRELVGSESEYLDRVLYDESGLDGPQTGPRDHVSGELGVLLLGQKEYVEALDLFVHNGHHLDAAYVAERVLTTEELRSYVDARKDDNAVNGPVARNSHAFGYSCSLKDLLGRRLAREGRWEEAFRYLPPGPKEDAERLSAAIRDGRPDEGPATTQSAWGWFIGVQPRTVVDRVRAKRLSEAASVVRTSGMEILGTQVEPDWYAFEGNFELPGAGPHRIAGNLNESYVSSIAQISPQLINVLVASEDERDRYRLNAPQPNHRFHYRYTAAELMWQSALNLPDNDIETMRALYTGGKYLLSMDDYRAANKFYRSLVWRNLNMPYAQLADRTRWFPEKPPE
ncbi:MAG: hypothetical protein HUU46_22920 [Candidatus Hydrogenedentes bacterium]|nr:hypothetical protein [Candidatus Hydrogenedentota bacterium]